MTDLLNVIPSFPTQWYSHIIPSLEKNLITTADLISYDAFEIAKRAHVPLSELRRLIHEVQHVLQEELGLAEEVNPTLLEGGEQEKCGENAESGPTGPGKQFKGRLRKTGKELVDQWQLISTLDRDIDTALGGGIPTGYITEIAGESGAGKTQFLLTLLLSAQLLSPHAQSLCITTESDLPTQRLSQLLTFHPALKHLSSSNIPTLARIQSIRASDLEAQDHILRFQVPVVVGRSNIKLIVIDSIAANFRAEQMGGGPAALAKRAQALNELGRLLRGLAREYDVAIVVANQVADRFEKLNVDSPGTIAELSIIPSKEERERAPKRIMSPNGRGTKVISKLPADLRIPPSDGEDDEEEDEKDSGETRARPTELPIEPPEAPLLTAATESTEKSPPPSPSPSLPNTSLPSTISTTPAPSSVPFEIPPLTNISPLLTMDHQQNFFTGWGDIPPHLLTPSQMHLKTPTLGLAWANQLSCRIVLLKNPEYINPILSSSSDNEKHLHRWRRYLKVVWSKWAPASSTSISNSSAISNDSSSTPPVEFEITRGGICSVDLRELHPQIEREDIGR
ncbi:MAG: hypothetical protein M1829_004102 [Trizodia sp. TS-e1964]|nr:MAG: hypothetical protein M1829_004102 [Trizodia sp. TS-e1964]